METIKESGSYIAVRIPEGSRYYMGGDNMLHLWKGSSELPGIQLKENQTGEILGLISEIKGEQLAYLTLDLIVPERIPFSEWNQWLILKKI